FRLSFFGALAAIVLVAGYVMFSNVFRSEAAIPNDRLAEVKRGDFAMSVVATGAIEPVATVEIKSKASGLIKEIYVDDGDKVSRGQVLVELDKEMLEAQLREAEANKQAAAAQLAEAHSDHASARNMKKKLEMDLRNLEDKVAYLRKQVARYEALFSERLIPHSDLEEREREVQEAHFQAEALKSELLMQGAQATLDRAEENLRYSTIRSPLDATVLKRHVEVGDAVSSILQLGSQATLILTLGDMQSVYFEGRVDETDIGKVFDGQEARVKVDAFRDQPFPGKVVRIAPLGEERDNVIGFEVRVAITDPQKILRARMSANAEIIVEQKKDVLLIPESAVIYDKSRKTFVNLYDPAAEGHCRRVPVEIGISDGTTTEVVAGVNAGNQVVRSDAGGLL
ncbi:MAG: efflux RND transporter periplasmic adaptor subunit, partial [Acidobacteriota bacterium]